VAEDIDTMDFRANTNKGIICENKATDICNKFIDIDKMKLAITSACIGKDICTISEFELFMKRDSTSKSKEGYSRCVDDDAMLYVQVFCL
jgi:hypothetical protein